jgi:TRAP-type mannitol/chloroaromatic compound transport system permease small subunit
VNERIERFVEGLGRLLGWLTLVMAVVTFTVVVLRYALDVGIIALQESVTYLHATVVLLGIAYALKHDDHVRVDMLYSRLSERGRAWINLGGHCLFLVPVSLTILFGSRGYVASSWRVLEGSAEVSGIPALFLLKTLIPAFAILLLAQGAVEIHRALRTIRDSAGRDRS